MKKFYRKATVLDVDGRFLVTLDGRPILSPGREKLALPTRPLAESVAAEWNAQGEEVVPQSMPMTRYANTALDRVRPRREAVVREIAAYAETDLLCYRTDNPAELAERQAFTWQPLLDWASDRFGAALRVTREVAPVAQDPSALEAFRAEIAARDEFSLSGLYSLTTASGSIVIALAVAEGRIGPEEASAASLLDETYQAEKWGEDPESVARWESIGAEIAAAARFLAVAMS